MLNILDMGFFFFEVRIFEKQKRLENVIRFIDGYFSKICKEKKKAKTEIFYH